MKAGIGQALRRKEDLRLVTGKGSYSDDVHMAGQAYAWMVRSVHAHACIRAIATDAARALPGVIAVFTGKDAAGLNPIPHRPTPGSPPRSEEHTSELQSLRHLVCRLLLE